jgi:hypothetical protein
MRETGAMLFKNFISTRDLGQHAPPSRPKLAEQIEPRRNGSRTVGA